MNGLSPPVSDCGSDLAAPASMSVRRHLYSTAVGLYPPARLLLKLDVVDLLKWAAVGPMAGKCISHCIRGEPTVVPAARLTFSATYSESIHTRCRSTYSFHVSAWLGPVQKASSWPHHLALTTSVHHEGADLLNTDFGKLSVEEPNPTAFWMP